MESVNLGSENVKSMSDSVKTIFESVHKVLLTHCKLNKKAMCAAHALGYNGFKRWHRYRSRCFFDLDVELSNVLFDKFRIRADFKDYELSYSPSSLDEHLRSWQKAILDGIQELGTLNKEFMEQTGTQCRVIDCALKKMSKDYEKVCRLLRRFTESDWLSLDMHLVDDRLHDKYKRKEEEDGGKWKGMSNYIQGKK